MKSRAFKRSSVICGMRSKLCHKKIEPEVVPSEEDLLLGGESRLYGAVNIKTARKKRYDGRDGFQSWMVAFANFFINFIIVGLGRMSGILYVVFMDTFHVGRQTASIPFSVQQSARNLFGPLAGILSQKYGVRSVILAGGLIGTISSACCFYVTDITWMTIMWGLVFGICTALTTTVNQVSIDQYFEKHRTTAGGLAFSGGCIGAFFFPVVIETLIKYYNLSGTFLIMGAIILNVVPASILLKEPPWISKNKLERKTSKRPAKNKKRRIDSDENENTDINVLSNTHSKSFIAEESENNYFDFEYLRQNSSFVYQLLEFSYASPERTEHEILAPEKLSVVEELVDIYTVGQTQDKSQLFPSEIMVGPPHYEHQLESHSFQRNKSVILGDNLSSDIFSKLHVLYQKNESEILSHFSIQNHNHVLKAVQALRALYELLKEDESSKNEVTVLADSIKEKEETLSIKRIPEMNEKYNNTFIDHIKTAIKLHTKPLFLLICLCRGVFMLTFIPVVTIIVDFAMDKGMKQEEGKYVIATLSLGDLLGRLCLGWVTDSGCLSLPRYMLVVMILLSITMSTFPLMYSALAIIPGVLIFGMLQGSLFIRHQILVSKYMDNHEQSIGMGCINLLSGFLGFALPAYIGYFRDTLGSYDNMFYVNSCICAAIGLLWILEPFFVRYFRKRSKYNKNTEYT